MVKLPWQSLKKKDIFPRGLTKPTENILFLV